MRLSSKSLLGKKWLYAIVVAGFLHGFCVSSVFAQLRSVGDGSLINADLDTGQEPDFWANVFGKHDAIAIANLAHQDAEVVSDIGTRELRVDRVCQAAQDEIAKRGMTQAVNQAVYKVDPTQRKEVGLIDHQSQSANVSSSRAPAHLKQVGFSPPSPTATAKSNSQVTDLKEIEVADLRLDAKQFGLQESHSASVPGHQTNDYREVKQLAVDNIHANCFNDVTFPSAAKCKSCHPDHYREWSVSPHAYAQLSPVFNAMSNKLNKLTNGTLSDFCIRCHAPIGMARGTEISKSNLDRPPEEREGVSCVVCHRVNQNWGKVSGRQALVGGGLDKPVYGPFGNEILQQALSDPDKYGVMTSGPKDSRIKSREVHSDSVPFFALTTSATCGSCHDVFGPDGFRLEDAFSEFKSSPAAKVKGQNCQDCHMGKTPGVASGYAHAPAAIVGNQCTPVRKHTNHMMIGPDYSVIHPGLFPHNPEAIREEHTPPDDLKAGLATMRQWLQFDHQSGWGTDDFERKLSKGFRFPPAWENQQKRFDAREILVDQFELLKEADVARHQLLSAGYKLGDVQFLGRNYKGLNFRIKVSNGTDGHGVPTGFDAERLVFLRIVVRDSQGKIVMVSGGLDPNGDVLDRHSVYVHNGELPLDRQLFSLQTKFMTRNVRGGEREQVLAVPFSLDPLPFARPATRPFTVLGRPVGARKHKQNIEVGGHRWANYTIGRKQLTGNGPYHADVQLIAAMVPVNLIHAVSSAGFDYGMSAKQIADEVVKGHVVVHTRHAVIDAK